MNNNINLNSSIGNKINNNNYVRHNKFQRANTQVITKDLTISITTIITTIMKYYQVIITLISISYHLNFLK